MVEIAATEVRSGNHGAQQENYQSEFQKLIIAPENGNGNVNGNYFTALLELPSNQAMELLTDNVDDDIVKRRRIDVNHSLPSKYSAFGSDKDLKGKSEPLDFGNIDPMAGSDCEKDKPSLKRKDRENKGKGARKKSKTTALEGEKLPYVHVRARRGQATDSHSLAERVRREKINARMKLLQDLVPGCNKISGTALVLDEIINHVQYLQRQVEYLSMRLAEVNPRIDFNLNSLIVGNESMMDCNYPNMATPLSLMWPEISLSGIKQQFEQQWHADTLTRPVWVKEENNHKLVTSENSLMT